MTVIQNPADPKVQAIFLKSHLKLMALGMKNSRISKTEMLAKASAITGKKYGRSKIDDAVADLQLIIDGKAK